MSVALVAAARVARDARPRTRLIGLPEPERWDADPARFQTTAVMPALVIESEPMAAVAVAPAVVIESEPMALAQTTPSESVVAEAETVLVLADQRVLAPVDDLVLAPESEPAECEPTEPDATLSRPAAAAHSPELMPSRPAAAARSPLPAHPTTPSPKLAPPEVAPRVARIRAQPEADWAWIEPWGFEVTASAPARPHPARSGRERHAHRRAASTQATRARPRRGAARQAPVRRGASMPGTAPRSRPGRARSVARPRRSGANPMIPLVVIAVAVAVCVWAEFPHPSVTQPRPLHTANAASLSFTPHPSAFALQTIPTAYLHDYWRVADEYGLDWTKLAAVGQIESDQGRSQEAGVSTGTNSAGAAGPAQFISSTWARYGVDADGRGSSNPYDPDDAITAMAAYLKASGAPEDWHTALFAYNHSNAYVDSVLALSRRYLAR